MKPNDKAIEAAILAIKENGPYYAGSKIRESMAKHLAEVALPPAYAAQFKSEDYAGLVKWLRDEAESLSEIYPPEAEAADAIEALLAERDELKGVIQSYQILLETQQGMFVAVQAERDALAAHLAPVDDEALVEIGARAICLENCALVEWRCKDDGVCKAPVGNFRDPNYVRPVSLGSSWRQSRAAIAAIRPHIEAAERERCAKIAEDQYYLMKNKQYISPEWMNGYISSTRDIAAAIRSGK